jgi:hypothetical protein
VPIIPEPKKLGQKDWAIESHLGYLVTLSQKKKKKERKKKRKIICKPKAT